jgi:hypothetical protein
MAESLGILREVVPRLDHQHEGSAALAALNDNRRPSAGTKKLPSSGLLGGFRFDKAPPPCLQQCLDQVLNASRGRRRRPGLRIGDRPVRPSSRWWTRQASNRSQRALLSTSISRRALSTGSTETKAPIPSPGTGAVRPSSKMVEENGGVGLLVRVLRGRGRFRGRCGAPSAHGRQLETIGPTFGRLWSPACSKTALWRARAGRSSDRLVALSQRQ